MKILLQDKFNNNIKELQFKLQYQFTDTNLLLAALTHKSFGSNNYERLEFLGDSVLSLVIAHYLYCNYAGLSEGKLSQHRASLVNQDILSKIATDLNLQQYVLLGGAEKKYHEVKKSILADIVEAIIAAIFLDSQNLTVVNNIILKLIIKYLSDDKLHYVEYKDYKSLLQEILQAKKLPLPNYQVLSESGPAHNKTFTISCEIDSLSLSAQATAATKKEASQLVASQIINMLNKNVSNK